MKASVADKILQRLQDFTEALETSEVISDRFTCRQVVTVASDCDGLRAVEKELPGQDSNLDQESQNLLCYRYTTG